MGEGDRPKGKLRAGYERGKKAYETYDDVSGKVETIQSLPDWWNWILSWFKTHTTAAVATTGAAGTAAAVGVVALVAPELLGGRERVETIRWGEAIVFEVVGQDTAGRAATFDVAVLPAAYAWVQGSADTLAREGAPIDAATLEGVVLAPALRQGLTRSGELIAVGVASREGGRATEEARARRRAETAAGWIAGFAPPQARIYTLNFGQYQESCAADASAGSAWQRPVILIGVRDKAPETTLAEALTDAMAGKSNLPDRGCYSAFELTPFR